MDNTVSTVNEVFIRINTAEKMLAPAITEFSTAAVLFDKAIDYIKSHANVVEKAAEAEKTEDAQ